MSWAQRGVRFALPACQCVDAGEGCTPRSTLTVCPLHPPPSVLKCEVLPCARPLCNLCSALPVGPQEYLLLYTKENASLSLVDYPSIKGSQIINEFALPSRGLLMTAEFASDVFILASDTKGRRRCNEQCQGFVPFRHRTPVVTLPHSSQCGEGGVRGGCSDRQAKVTCSP